MFPSTSLHRSLAALAVVGALTSFAGAAQAQDAPRKFDLTCDAHSTDGVHAISTTLRFAIDLDNGSMRPYHDGKLQAAVPIKVTDDLLTLRDEDQAAVNDLGAAHVLETVDRHNGAFTSVMKFSKAGAETDEARTEGQCAFARYTGADGKPLY